MGRSLRLTTKSDSSGGDEATVLSLLAGRGAAEPAGLGLGLYIAFEIAKAHGGTIDVTSTPELTCFTLRMPLQR